jgi:hypothetical protein
MGNGDRETATGKRRLGNGDWETATRKRRLGKQEGTSHRSTVERKRRRR